MIEWKRHKGNCYDICSIDDIPHDTDEEKLKHDNALIEYENALTKPTNWLFQVIVDNMKEWQAMAERARNWDQYNTATTEAEPANDYPPTEPANTLRDTCIYNTRVEKKPFSEICNTINKEFPESFLDEKCAEQALRRYCKRENLPYPYGKRGRKSL